MFTYNNITSDYMGCEAYDIDVNICPPIKTITADIQFTNKSYITSRTFQPRPIKVTITFKSNSLQTYFSGLLGLSTWLVTNAVKPLILNDWNSEVYFWAVLENPSAINRISTMGEATLNFICYDCNIYNVADDTVFWDADAFLLGGV
jgi:predicted phage tail component-like protein